MSDLFNVDEVFQMAEEMEIAGAKYYRDAAARFSDNPRAKMLKTLAQMEGEHLKQFAAIRAQVRAAVSLPKTWDPDDDAAKYLNALSEHKVFHPKEDPSQRFSGNETLRDILQKAIGMEKESIVFYTGIKELVPANLGRAQVGEIIRQEMGHVTMLTNELLVLN